ncbi:MAG: hypothetical protein Q8R28_16105 [Dehalococcoidia bacterium]|nr:hypothetical protein [Dehalococcoidia bacterium]
MPNHTHRVLLITGGGRGTASPLPQPDGWTPVRAPNLGGPAPVSLGAIVGSFKSAAARRINGLLDTHCAQVWQRNYLEHVVCDEEKLKTIRTRSGGGGPVSPGLPGNEKD